MEQYRAKHTTVAAVEVAIVANGKPTDERQFVIDGVCMVDAQTFLAFYEPIPAAAIEQPFPSLPTLQDHMDAVTFATKSRAAVEAFVASATGPGSAPQAAAAVSADKPKPPAMTLMAAVIQAVREMPRNAEQIRNRAGELLEKTVKASSVSGTISILKDKGEIHRVGFDWHYGPAPRNAVPAPTPTAEPQSSALKPKGVMKPVREALLEAITAHPMDAVQVAKHLSDRGYTVDSKETTKLLMELRNAAKVRRGDGQDPRWHPARVADIARGAHV